MTDSSRRLIAGHILPSPPSLAGESKSEPQSAPSPLGEGWGGGCFDHEALVTPLPARALRARHSDAPHRVLSTTAAEGRLCLPHKGGGNRSKLPDIRDVAPAGAAA